MLRVAQTRLLCRSCRSDVLRILEDGFYPQIRHKSPGVSRSSLCGRSQRYFSCMQPTSASHNRNTERSSTERPEVDIQAGESQLDHDAVVAVLEKELGMSLEEAMEKDRAAVEALVAGLALTDDSGKLVDFGGHPLQYLRDGGATSTDVVREARNVFGDTLPAGTLNEEEYQLYRRLYGDPSTTLENVPVDVGDSEVDNDSRNARHALYSVEGEEIEYSVTQNIQSDKSTHASQNERQDGSGLVPDEGPGSHNFAAFNDAHQIAASLDGELVEGATDGHLEDDQDELMFRAHPLTTLGKFTTSPKTIFLPGNEFVRPVERMMSDFSNKHLKEVSEKTFGGPGLPNSPLTPRSGKLTPQIPIPLEAGQSLMGEMEANSFVTSVMPPTYASILSVLVETRKRLGTSWLARLLAREGGPRILDASSGGVGIIAWREMVKAHWDAIHSSDRNPPPVPSSKSVVLVGSDTLRHRAAKMLENTTFVPRLPDYVHTRDVPTLEDDRPAQQRKQFDVVIAPHSLFTLKEDWQRKQHVQNLWSLLSSEGGVLILIEKGMPRGFEAIAGAREMLLERYIANPPGHQTQYSKTPEEDPTHKKETAMIVAPCTNHERCPMYTVPGLSKGRRDICSFQQRYIRPPFLQRILGASDRNHDDVDFSYLSIMKGDDLRLRDFQDWTHVEDPSSAPMVSKTLDTLELSSSILKNARQGFEETAPGKTAPISQSGVVSTSRLPITHQLPRTVMPPIKRKGHVSLDVCTPAGVIERWTIPRSFSKQAYRDARKSDWGDLWGLGAKTQIPRNLSLGVSEKDLASRKKNGGEAIVGKGRGRKEGLKIKAEQVLEEREKDRLAQIQEQDEFMMELDEELDGIPGSTNTTPNIAARQHPPTSSKFARSHQEHRSDEDDSISQILSEWEEEYDQVDGSAKRQTRRLNKLDKKKMKKTLRTMDQGRSS